MHRTVLRNITCITQVTLRLITPAKDINLSSAEPAQRTISSVRDLRLFIAAACAEYSTHSTYLHRVMTHVVSQAKAAEGDGASRKGKGSKQQSSEGVTPKFLGQVSSLFCLLWVSSLNTSSEKYLGDCFCHYTVMAMSFRICCQPVFSSTCI